jgi:hypothetical protein
MNDEEILLMFRMLYQILENQCEFDEAGKRIYPMRHDVRTAEIMNECEKIICAYKRKLNKYW